MRWPLKTLGNAVHREVWVRASRPAPGVHGLGNARHYHGGEKCKGRCWSSGPGGAATTNRSQRRQPSGQDSQRAQCHELKKTENCLYVAVHRHNVSKSGNLELPYVLFTAVSYPSEKSV